MAHFLGKNSPATRSLKGNRLLLTSQPPGIPDIYLIDLGKMKVCLYLGDTWCF